MSGTPIVMGVDIGSTTSKCILLRDGMVLGSAVESHGAGTGGPQRAMNAALRSARLEAMDISCTVATGYGRNSLSVADTARSELSCHARGARHLCPDARTVIDIGGQDVKIIRLDGDGRMQDFVMNGKCAAGTGRFLDVMARVLELEVSRLAEVGRHAKEHLEISSTCTVFAESEVISHLAAAARIEDIVAGIHCSVARRIVGLARRTIPQPTVVMTGGVAQNAGVAGAIQAELCLPLRVAPLPQLVGALGAALYAADLKQEDST